MTCEFTLYTVTDPKAAAADDSALESALNTPHLIDNSVLLGDAEPVSEADIPTKVLFSCCDITHAMHLALEHDEEPASGNYRSFRKFLANLVSASGGVAFCAATDEVITGENTHGYVYPSVNEYTPMLTVACFYMPDKPFSVYAERFVDGLAELLPFALPRTYGKSETPEYIYSDNKKQQLIDFLKNEQAPVWYATAPVTHVLISDATRKVSADGFRASRVALSVCASVWEYPEWRYALTRVLEFMMTLFDGFFAQIVPHEQLGTAAWWWQGIPKNTGYVFAVGKPYMPLIPDCGSEKNISKNDRFAMFDENALPIIPQELISFPKRGAHNRAITRNDFTPAALIPLDTERNV